MISSISGSDALAIAAGVGKRRKSTGVTMLTRASVHCAERMVATSSSHGLRCSSAQVAPGYAFCKPAMIFAMRAGEVLSRGFAVFFAGAFAGAGLRARLVAVVFCAAVFCGVGMGDQPRRSSIASGVMRMQV